MSICTSSGARFLACALGLAGAASAPAVMAQQGVPGFSVGEARPRSSFVARLQAGRAPVVIWKI
jgi:hypothetical protein